MGDTSPKSKQKQKQQHDTKKKQTASNTAAKQAAFSPANAGLDLPKKKGGK